MYASETTKCTQLPQFHVYFDTIVRAVNLVLLRIGDIQQSAFFCLGRK